MLRGLVLLLVVGHSHEWAAPFLGSHFPSAHLRASLPSFKAWIPLLCSRGIPSGELQRRCAPRLRMQEGGSPEGGGDEFGLAGIGGLSGLAALGLTNTNPVPMGMSNAGKEEREERVVSGDGGEGSEGAEGSKLKLGDRAMVLVKTIELSKQAMAAGRARNLLLFHVFLRHLYLFAHFPFSPIVSSPPVLSFLLLFLVSRLSPPSLPSIAPIHPLPPSHSNPPSAPLTLHPSHRSRRKRPRRHRHGRLGRCC